MVFLGPAGLFLRMELSRNLFGPTHIDLQLLFWKYGHIFFVSNLAPFWTFLPFLSPVWLLGGLRISSKNVLGTSSFTLPALVLKVKSYLFVFIWPHFEPFDPFGTMLSYFWSCDQVQDLFWDLQKWTVNFSFTSMSLSFSF